VQRSDSPHSPVALARAVDAACTRRPALSVAHTPKTGGTSMKRDSTIFGVSFFTNENCVSTMAKHASAAVGTLYREPHAHLLSL
jgi:hypothetical protein